MNITLHIINCQLYLAVAGQPLKFFPTKPAVYCSTEPPKQAGNLAFVGRAGRGVGGGGGKYSVILGTIHY